MPKRYHQPLNKVKVIALTQQNEQANIARLAALFTAFFSFIFFFFSFFFGGFQWRVPGEQT